VSLAAVILGHRDVPQIERLAERLGCPVWVHYDAKSPAAEHEQLARSARLEAVPDPVRVIWGHWSMVAATLRGLHAVAGDPDHVLILSGQTYPIKPPDQLEARLEAATYLERFPLPFARWGPDGGVDRVAFRWVAAPRWLPERAPIPPMVRVPGRRRFPPVRLFGGSQWGVLHRGARRYVLGIPSTDPVIQMFRHACVPDELFFQTVLSNSPLRDQLVDDNLHHIKWADTAHPEPITQEDLAVLATSTAFFARRFAAGDPLLDTIDRELLAVD
jgi:hypothetical protein